MRGPRAAIASGAVAAVLVAGVIVGVAASGCERTGPGLPAQPAPTAPPPPAPPAARPADSAQAAGAAAGTHWPLAARKDAVAAGAAVIAKHQCTRCHEIDGLPGAGRPFDCTSCHVFLLGLEPGGRQFEEIAAKNGRDVLDRYQRNIKHLVTVPRLSGLARRVRPDWIASFLAAPYDLRPLLDESMIRNRLDAGEIHALVRYFAAIADAPDPDAPAEAPAAAPPAPPDAARIARGQERFVTWGCPGCHTVGNLALGAQTAAALEAARSSALLAPNLRFARDRDRPDVLVDWIVDPLALAPGTAMPKMGVPVADAEAIRDFLLYAPVDVPPAPPAEPLYAMPPPVARDVGWAEVKERVLGTVCVHCHMNDHEKDTGPGNGGGLGYAGRGLALRTYEMAMRGALGPDGRRYSVFAPLPGERWPRILQVLLERRVEDRRDHVPPLADHARPPFGDGLTGMPLGLPALDDEQLGILRRWIDLGCPGPTAVTGKPGFTDGFLVPDGPVAHNHGCEARAPEEPPPAWATRPPATPAPAAAPAPPPGSPARGSTPR